jgi:DNA-binding protein HU-beta
MRLRAKLFERMPEVSKKLLPGPKITDRRRALSITLPEQAIRGLHPSAVTPEQEGNNCMSKAFIAQVIQEAADLPGTAATRTAGAVIDAIVRELKKNGRFTLPSFGTFIVRKTKARKGLNPRTGEPIKVKAGKTVRFKASPTLKKIV